MTLRDGGYDYEDGCPECGAGVREEYDERARVTTYTCKEDDEVCGWTATDEEEDEDGNA